VLSSSINQNDPTQVSASLEIDVRRENRADVDKALAEAGGVYGRASSRPAEGQPALEDKVRFQVTINDADNLPARERTTMGVETADVTQSANDLELTAVALGGRKVTSDWAQDPGGQSIARLVLDVPLSKSGELLKKARDQGKVLSIQHEQAPTAPDGAVGRARLTVTFATADPILARDQGLGSSIRSGLATSAQWLLASVTWIVVGLCLVLPWAIVLWIAWKIVRSRRKRAPEPAVA
jgi:hypothetical protein